MNQIDPRAVINILGGKIAALNIENAALQIRVADLEAELEKNKAERVNEQQPGVATK